MINDTAIRHDILGFCERQLVTVGGEEVEKEMVIIVLVKLRWNQCSIYDSQCKFSSKYVVTLNVP